MNEPAPQHYFPEAVCRAMRAGGGAATCVPVQLGEQTWEAALFIHLAEPECERDRQVLAEAQRPLPVGIEADLIENQHAAVVVLRLEVHTLAGDPLASEILLVPGDGTSHLEALKLLAAQPRLCWFFGDADFRILHSQQHPLDEEHHRSFGELLRDALRHDFLVGCTTHYDAQAALAEVTGHYELREGAERTEYRTLPVGTDGTRKARS